MSHWSLNKTLNYWMEQEIKPKNKLFQIFYILFIIIDSFGNLLWSHIKEWLHIEDIQ